MSTIITSDSGICPINTDTMIPDQVTTGSIGYRDTIEINNDKILEDSKKGIIYRTSAPIDEDYISMFNKYIKDNDIVHLSLGSHISSTSVNSSYRIAREINEERKHKIYVVDSNTGATGGTLINEIAIKLAKEGINATEIKDRLDIIKYRINTSFFVPDPSGFLRSGRNGYAIKITEQAIKLLNIKLRVDFDIEGKLVVKGIYRHNINKSFDEIKDSAISNIDHDYPIIIGNVKEDKIDMEQLKQYLENKYDNQVLNKQINGVVAAYGSNDLVEISYIKKLNY